jgi:hypothetical protein
MGADGMSSNESSLQDGMVTNGKQRHTVWRSKINTPNRFKELWTKLIAFGEAAYFSHHLSLLYISLYLPVSPCISL